MQKVQVENLNLGIYPVDDRVILIVESALDWINHNTSLVIDYNNDEELQLLSPSIKLFIIKYVDLMMLSTGVSSESISGLSQSYDTTNKSDLLWQYANELLGDYMTSQMSFVTAKRKWNTH